MIRCHESLINLVEACFAGNLCYVCGADDRKRHNPSVFVCLVVVQDYFVIGVLMATGCWPAWRVCVQGKHDLYMCVGGRVFPAIAARL